ncbi:MAG: acylneuraminate cytidylyltransferase family protein [Deltaproteobacteria bacterium]|nr:MAG: acylneuraminate cytidylyltransferase family protein [Deltaproteobacteria bacterium]
MTKRNILGIIPARGGSKSIPNKNMVMLGGKPLISYTIDAAKGSTLLSRIILTTDDKDIAEFGKKQGVEVPFLRPASLSQDTTPTIPVVQHALRFLKDKHDYAPDVVVLLQPTSPLRTHQHIDEAVELFFKSGADSVVSVVEVPHQYNPLSVMEIKAEKLKPFIDGEGTRLLRRQNKPKFYARNGAAIYVTRREVIENDDSFFGKDCRPYIMRAEESVDIDSYFDLEIAEMILSKK